MKKVYCIAYALVLTILFMTTGGASNAAAQNQFWVYIGTDNHRGPGKGIYLFRLDVAAGTVSEVGLAAELGDPGWQAISADGKFLYSVGNDQDHSRSIAAAFGLDPKTGALTLLNTQPTNGEDSPHLDIDPGRTCAVVANYGSGNMSVMPIGSDGSLQPPTDVIQHTGSSVNPDRQKHAYPHSCNFDPSGKYVLTPDLGVDKVYVYKFDAAGRSLSPADPPWVTVAPGSGPRHLSFSPDGKFAYLINEMGGSLDVYAWDATKGQLRAVQTISTLSADFHGTNTSAEVHVHPNGKFLYATNRGPDDLAIFAVDPTSGKLKPIGYEPTGGKGPRDFKMDPTGTFLFVTNQYSDSVIVFRIDANSGKLSRVRAMDMKAPTPICVTFLAVQK